MSDEHRDKLIHELAQDFNDPPATPRDEIWARIEQARRPASVLGGRRLSSPWFWMPAAAAAILLLGIMIGRDSLRQQAETAVQEYRQELAGKNARTLFRLAAGPTLGKTETLLTQYRSGSLAGDGAAVASRAGNLVSETRLLMDSPAGDDPELRLLLEDMELVLLRIQNSARRGAAADREEIKQVIQERNLLFRLRAKIPSGGVEFPGA